MAGTANEEGGVANYARVYSFSHAPPVNEVITDSLCSLLTLSNKDITNALNNQCTLFSADEVLIGYRGVANFGATIHVHYLDSTHAQ